jgi:valyl-tRNA synthetase
MMMLGLHVMEEVPFRDVYIHALVRDMEGQKMSKSRGNVVDPLDVMAQFGTDALRFTLAALAAQGREIRLSGDRIEGYRNFANKLWNAARFVLSNLEGYRPALARKAPPTLAERWIRSRLHRTIAETRQGLSKYRFNDAASAIYQFVWHDYCDWYLEWSKLTLYRDEDPAARARTQATLIEVLEATLRLLHPFMPFITEEIWQRLPKGHTAPKSIVIARYPRVQKRQRDVSAEADIAPVMAVISGIRSIRSEFRIPPSRTLSVVIKPTPTVEPVLRAESAAIGALGKAEVRVDPGAERAADAVLKVVEGSEVHVSLTGVVDVEAERGRLGRDLRRIEDELARTEAKLAREDFRQRAPAEVVAREEVRRSEQLALQSTLREGLARLDALDAR